MSGGMLASAEHLAERITGAINSRLALRRQNREMAAKFRPGDVMFVGHPKSGNTWMAYMLAVLHQRHDPETVTTATVGQFIPVIHARDADVDSFPKLATPRIFRNEGPQFPDVYPRTLYIVRDPRSALVSYYHHCKHDTGNQAWSLDDFVDEMLEYGCIRSLEPFLVRWDRQVLDWHERKSRQAVHIVRYEDLKSDCLAELHKVASFCGLPTESTLLETAVRKGSFSEMRKQEVEHGAEAFPGEKGSRGFFMRKGEVEGWRDELSARSLKRIEEAFAPAMELTGYKRAS